MTATVSGPLAGECARCLEPFTSAMKVRFQELFALGGDAELADGADDEDSYRLDGSGLLDLEPALRDAVVLELPLSPLCEDGCQGLCAECGVRLADAEPGHGHEQRGTMWAALKDFRAEQPDGGRRLLTARGRSTGRESRTGTVTTAPDRRRAGTGKGAVKWQYPSARCRAATPGRGARSGRQRRRSSWPARTAASPSFRTRPARPAAPTTGARSSRLPDHAVTGADAMHGRALREGAGR